MGNGEKFDTNKDRWDLLPWGAVRQIVKVLTYGAKKYDDHNWQLVENMEQRYFAALLRHVVAWFGGEQNDPESGLPHLAHAGCCILFLLWKDGYK
jgi:hypothetical protein